MMKALFLIFLAGGFFIGTGHALGKSNAVNEDVIVSETDGNTESPGAKIDTEAEARMSSLIDFVMANQMSLVESCDDPEKKIQLNKGTFQFGELGCKVENIKAFIGSAEIEFRLENCLIGDTKKPDRTYVLGAPSIGTFQFISEGEKKQPLYPCSN